MSQIVCTGSTKVKVGKTVISADERLYWYVWHNTGNELKLFCPCLSSTCNKNYMSQSRILPLMIICVTLKHYTLYPMDEPNGFDMSEHCLPFAVTIAAHQLWTTIGAAQHVNTSCALLAAKSCA
jgi:hypothetical protein